MLTRRRFVQTAGLAAAATMQDRPLWSRPRRRQPNFVIVLADDMGFSDAGCYGGEIRTPVFDKLAAGGIRFTQMYSTARCGPSRNCLLTGMYAQQTAADVMTPGKIPDYVSFLPTHLKTAGYRTYHSGKWHMRLDPQAGGVDFDRTYTMLDEMRFFTQTKHALDGKLLPKPEEEYYSTTAIADYAVDFLKDHQQNYSEQPFFLYLAFHAPHFPLQAPQADIQAYRGLFDDGWDVMRKRRHKKLLEEKIVNCGLAPLEPAIFPEWNLPAEELSRRIGLGEVARAAPWNSLTEEQKKFQSMKMSIHAAMITRMDTETGKVLDQIKRMNVFDDTVVIFLSDNGASAEELIRGDGHDPRAVPGSAGSHLSIGPAWATAADTPFRLHKSYVHEGGIASPFVVHWPNGINQAGKLNHSVCHFIDITPTLVDLAGGAPQKDGVGWSGKSLMPAIRSNQTVHRSFLYFDHSNNRALRTEKWKIVARGTKGDWELYNMESDRCEQNNLLGTNLTLAKEMEATWRQCHDRYLQQRQAAEPTKRKLMPAALVGS